MSGTTPDSVTYPSISYGLLGPYEPTTISVLEVGADPTGNDDCSLLFQQAVDSLPASGGILSIPSGRYLFTYGVGLPSNVTVRPEGPGSTTIVAQANYPGALMGAAYSFFYNKNFDATVITDTDIVVEGIKFDYSWRTTSNAMHPLNFRMVQRLTIRNNYFYYGGNSIAVRASHEVWVEGNFAYEFRNCAWDFWEGPGTTYLRGNYAETSDTAQMINYNPEVSPVATSPLNVIGRRLIVEGNVCRATGAVSEPCQIEPLGNRQNGIFEVVIDGNQFFRTYLVLRGRVESALITNNVFGDYPASNTNVISIYPLNGYTPKGIVISGNSIADPGTTAASFGVIRCETNSAVITGNIITGTGYTGDPFYSGVYTPNMYGNYFEKLGVTGRMQQGFVLSNPNDGVNDLRSCIGWVDTDGDPLRMYMTGNFHQFYSTNADGTARQIWSMQANNDSAQWGILIGASFSDQVRISPATGLTATGSTSGTALVLSKNFNEVTSVAVGTGVRLPTAGATSVTGLRVTVWNAGPNPLNVYPASGGQINALGTNIPDTIAAGANKTYVGMSATLYRSET